MGQVSEGSKKERFQFIADNRSEFGVRYLCTRLYVSRGGFYKWANRPLGNNEANTKLLNEIKRLFVLHSGNYGYPRIYRALRDEGWQVNRKRVARLMREERLVGKAAKLYRRKKLPANRCVSVDNLRYKKPAPKSPNEQWAGDVSYLSFKGSWIYLSVVLDLYSRKVIGWSLDTQRTTSLTLASLSMALSQREVKEGLIFHSDKGAEYASHVFQSALKEAGIRPSMNRPKSMIDNIHVESFFRTFKTESYHGEYFHDRAALAERTRWYLDDYYNHQRIHSSLGFKTPHCYETMVA